MRRRQEILADLQAQVNANNNNGAQEFVVREPYNASAPYTIERIERPYTVEQRYPIEQPPPYQEVASAPRQVQEEPPPMIQSKRWF